MKIDTAMAVKKMHTQWAVECSDLRLDSYTSILEKVPSDFVKSAIRKLFNEPERKRIPTLRDLFMACREFKTPEDMQQGEAKKHWADAYHDDVMQKRDAKMPDWKQTLAECETPKEKIAFLEYLDNLCGINVGSAMIFAPVMANIASGEEITTGEAR